MDSFFNWIDSRFGIKEPHRRFLHRRLPERITYLYCLGGVAFTLFLCLLFTGMLLSLYYVPSEQEAFQSTLRLTKEVRLGWLIRSLHKWAAHLFIVFIILHALRVIVHRAYRPPRELNWITGTLTLVVAFASGFTGYLLPWDQRAYWATEVGTSMVATVPLIGNHLLYLIRGGPDVSGVTLVRFYSLHVLWLPLIMGFLLWAHFHMVKHQGISGGL
jgi:quinol-cytochrome oxidoreductase complex cytochrome b subunit